MVDLKTWLREQGLSARELSGHLGVPLTTPLTHPVAHRTVGAGDQPVMGTITSYKIIQPFGVSSRWHRAFVDPIFYCWERHFQ